MIKKNLSNGSNLVILSNNSGIGELAHEIGHSSRKSILSNLTKDAPQGFNNIANGRDNSIGVKEGIKRLIKGKALVKEERLANKKGISELKRAGIDDKDLKAIKDKYRLSEQGYENTSNAYYKSPIANKIQIPSRRK